MAKNTKSMLLLQYATAITGCMTVVGYGSMISWSSPALPFLESTESDIKITLNQSSWIASLNLIGLSIGFLLNPLFIDRIGRKWTLIMFAVPQIISWLMIILAKSHITLYCARLIGGAGYGGGLCAMSVYMTEICNKDNRGIFMLLIRLSKGLGCTLIMLLGAFFTYQQMNFVLLMLPILFLLIFFAMPDCQRRIEKEKSNSQECGVYVIQHHLESANEINKNSSKTPVNIEPDRLEERQGIIVFLRETNIWKLFSNSTNRKALIIVISTGLLSTLSGQVAVGAFGQKIFSYKTTPMDPKKAMILWSSLNAITCLGSMQVIERINRRNILIFSGVISSISLFIIGAYFYVEESILLSSELSGWIPIIFLSFVSVFLTSGPSNLFTIYQGELFANEVKSIAVTVVKLVNPFFKFLSVYYFQELETIVYVYGIFWCFSICCLLGTILIYLMAPESRGKTIEEIQENLKKRSLFYRIHYCGSQKG